MSWFVGLCLIGLKSCHPYHELGAQREAYRDEPQGSDPAGPGCRARHGPDHYQDHGQEGGGAFRWQVSPLETGR